MEAQINKFGVLVIRPTTETEDTALRAWKQSAWVKMNDIRRAEDGHWRGSFVELMDVTKPHD